MGDAFINNNVDRSNVWITTKHSYDEGLQSIETSLDNSLDFVRTVDYYRMLIALSSLLQCALQMRIKSVDLYLLHSPIAGGADILAAWDMMEKMKKMGKAKYVLFKGVTT